MATGLRKEARSQNPTGVKPFLNGGIASSQQERIGEVLSIFAVVDREDSV